MKFLSFIFILLELINLSLLLIPNWNLKYSSVDLLPDGSSKNDIIIYDYNYNGASYDRNFHAVLTKNITRSDSNIINAQNYFIMTINNKQSIDKTNWEDIESSYFIQGTGHFVCPKGSNFIHQYKDQQLIEIKPNGFPSTDNDWELICYNQYRKNWMFQGFLNSKSKIPLFGKYLTNYYDSNRNVWRYKNVDEGIFDFLWTTEETGSSTQKFNMFALVRLYKNITLRNYEIQCHEDNDMGVGGLNENLIDYKSTYMHAYFDHRSKLFFWMVSNDTDEFRSGYSTEPIDIKGKNVNVGKINNIVSPFLFIKKMDIINLNMIRNSRFVIYEVSDENKEIYKGIIDIELNQIIFHTNEKFRNFTPLTNHSIFALTDTKAYEICFIKDNNGKCLERCPSGQKFVLNNKEGNHCANDCYNFTLIPKEICSDYCNNTIYSFKNKNCGLCKDIDSENQYKIMDQEGCVKEKPNNTYIFNEKYKLLKNCSEHCINCIDSEICNECEEGYELDNYKCKKIEKCYDNCKKCTRHSEDENNQHCTECNQTFYYFNKNGVGNCLKECPDEYYINNINCSKCHENCSTCSNGPEDINGTENENCNSCKTGYLLEAEGGFKNCVEECPNGTYISDNKFCKEIIPDKDKESLLSFAYIIFIGFCLFIATICIYKNICNNKTKDNELINRIHKELEDNNRLIDG